MIKFLLSFALTLICICSSAQVFGPKDCAWEPGPDFRCSWVRCDDVIPDIWKEHPQANHIFAVHNAWSIETAEGRIVPEYIIWKNDSIDSVTAWDACQFAYNYFNTKPEERKYEHKDFLFLVRLVKKGQ